MTFKIIFFLASRVYKTLSSVSPLWIVLHEESGTGHEGRGGDLQNQVSHNSFGEHRFVLKQSLSV